MQRRASEEERNRERARLPLEWARESDPQRKADTLWVIREVYRNDGLFDQLQQLINAEVKAANATATLALYEKLTGERMKLQLELGHKPAPVKPEEARRRKEAQLEALNTNLENLVKMLKDYGLVPADENGVRRR